jgi:hypothetical protein
LNELAAEKILAWAGKHLPKHYADLAFIAREHPNMIDHQLVSRLRQMKFAAESEQELYRKQGMASSRSIPNAFRSPQHLGLAQKEWSQAVGDSILVNATEAARKDTLCSFAYVNGLVDDFWQQTLRHL